MTQNDIERFGKILEEEGKALDDMCGGQALLRKAVMDRDWSRLMDVTAAVNEKSVIFERLDAERDLLQSGMDRETLRPYLGTLGGLRAKLLRCRTETRALGEYIAVTKNFIQGIIDEALPQSTNRTYTKQGFVRRQPQSVVLDRLL